MNSDWQMGKSLTEVNQHLLDKQLKCDVTFIFPKDDGSSRISRSIGAHALFLTSRSPVFDVMYSERWSQQRESRNVRIEDATYENFKEFLRFIYTDECNMTADNVLALLYLSQKYIVTTLERICTKYAEEELNANTACTLYQRSTEFNANELKLRSIEYICKNAAAILKSENVGSLSQENLLHIVSSNYLCCGNETAVYEGCIKWATAVSKAKGVEASDEALRDCLGPVLYQLRFAQLKTESLVQLLGKTWIISPEEKGHLLSYCGVGERHPDMKFCTAPRAYNKFQIDRFKKLSDRSFSKNSDIQKSKDRFHSLNFQVNRSILLMGITLQSGVTSDNKRIFDSGTLKIQKENSEDGPILTVKVKKRLGDETVDVTFDPVHISANISYTVNFEYDTTPEYTTSFQSWVAKSSSGYSNSSVSVTSDNSGINFTFSNTGNSESHTSATSGQFSKLIHDIFRTQ